MSVVRLPSFILAELGFARLPGKGLPEKRYYVQGKELHAVDEVGVEWVKSESEMNSSEYDIFSSMVERFGFSHYEPYTLAQ